MATLENLNNTAKLFNDSQTKTCNVALKACPESSSIGKLHNLVTSVSTEVANKAQTAIEGWEKKCKRQQ